MAKIKIDAKKCKGCGLCVEFCPAKIIALDKHIGKSGTNAAFVVDISKCKGCGFCAIICPDCAIEVSR